MTADQALALVEARRRELQIGAHLRPQERERALVWSNGAHRVAWIVTLRSRWGWVRADIDDQTGEILSVRRSM